MDHVNQAQPRHARPRTQKCWVPCGALPLPAQMLQSVLESPRPSSQPLLLQSRHGGVSPCLNTLVTGSWPRLPPPQPVPFPHSSNTQHSSFYGTESFLPTPFPNPPYWD